MNVFVGENGTGKTHLLKVAYAACDITKTKRSLASKLIDVFLPYERRIGRLVYRTSKSTRAVAEVYRGDTKVRSSFSNHSSVPKSARILGKNAWVENEIESVFIPVKEMLANAPGFRGLYNLREIEFKEVYADILDRAYRPILRGQPDARRKRLLKILQNSIDGKVIREEERFFLKNKQGELEFALLAEGMRKLALLWLLIQNGTLLDGSVLFWDEPEANINPNHSYTFLHLMKKDEKAFVLVAVLGVPLDMALLGDFKNRLLKRLRKEAAVDWVRRYIKDCIVVTPRIWNTLFPEYPLTISSYIPIQYTIPPRP